MTHLQFGTRREFLKNGRRRGVRNACTFPKEEYHEQGN